MTEQEFTELVEEIRPELIRIASRRCGRDLAEDAIQMAVIKVWELGQWKTADSAVVAGWLRHKAKSRGQDEFKKIDRFRGAQKNLRVLSDKGWKRAYDPNSRDKEAGQ